MNEAQLGISRNYADKIQASNREAVGVVLLVLDCGCIKAAPFDCRGESVGRTAQLRVISGDKRRICVKCRKDEGKNPDRIRESNLLWFQPCPFPKREREKLAKRILSGKGVR